jgi:HSP20 family protein
MAEKKETALTSEVERFFERPFGAAFHWPSFRGFVLPQPAEWVPEIGVFERDNRLVTTVDLPGLKKEDVKVEVTDGNLTVSGERRIESEEKKDNVYRRERAYGSFYRTVPLPEGAKLDDVKATFADGVLEITVPLPAKAEAKPRSVPIQEAAAPAKSAAA